MRAIRVEKHGGPETINRKATEARVTLASELLAENTTATTVDTLERPRNTNAAHLKGNTVIVQLPAFGIAAVRIK